MDTFKIFYEVADKYWYSNTLINDNWAFEHQIRYTIPQLKFDLYQRIKNV